MEFGTESIDLINGVFIVGGQKVRDGQKSRAQGILEKQRLLVNKDVFKDQTRADLNRHQSRLLCITFV